MREAVEGYVKRSANMAVGFDTSIIIALLRRDI